MASITIKDLALSQALDRKAMLCIQGANGLWTVGAFKAFAPAVASVVPVVNYFQLTNNYSYTYVDKMITQVTNLNVNSSGNNSPVTAVVISSLGG
jgi:hypothetical protein